MRAILFILLLGVVGCAGRKPGNNNTIETKTNLVGRVFYRTGANTWRTDGRTNAYVEIDVPPGARPKFQPLP